MLPGHYEAVTRSSDDALISKSLEGIVLSWNEGAERLYGYTADDIVGRLLRRTACGASSNSCSNLVDNAVKCCPADRRR